MIKYFLAGLIAITVYSSSNLVMAQEYLYDIRLSLVNEAYEDALELFNEKVKTDNNNAELWYLGGMAFNKMMRPDSSLLCFQKAVSLDPDDEKIGTALASVYINMQQYSRAKEIYIDMIARDSTRLSPYIQLGSLLLRNREPEKALDIYKKLIERKPDNFSFMKSMATCYRNMGDDMSAVAWYKKANEQYREDLSVNIALAALYLKMKNYKEGLEIAERGLEIERTNHDLLFWSGFFNYTLGYYHQAINRLILAEKSGNVSPNVKKYIGICYYLTKNYESALEYLEMVAMDLQDHRIFNYLGIIYRIKEDPLISEAYFYNSLEVLAPAVDEITSTYLHLIDTYKMTGANEKIMEAYKSALVLDSENLFLNYGLAYTYDYYLNNKDDALDYYQRFSKLAAGKSSEHSDLPTLLDHSAARIKSIREDMFFRGQ
jgi:tetratricopeptide (TPR) repeat protein